MTVPQGKSVAPSIAEALRLCREKRFEEAIAAARSGLVESNNSPAARLVLARAYYGAGFEKEALAELVGLAERVGANVAVWRLIGRIHFENGRRDEAQRALRKVVEHQPDDGYGLALLEVIEGQRPAFDGLASGTLASLYLSQGLRDAAVAVLRKLATERPNDLEIAARLSRLLAGED